ncbi:hypothetical protein BD410DRAFT_275431 [Rickenella mellea]|uniref:Uncharacterized protein n=1 Tax=Rickenella mellea TaxID=50990 RepID=A0A4Y7Q3F3_9AGAM|nr:hypothetical protein BD410DRAFT_275431 [Rickenella mellea]
MPLRSSGIPQETMVFGSQSLISRDFRQFVINLTSRHLLKGPDVTPVSTKWSLVVVVTLKLK